MSVQSSELYAQWLHVLMHYAKSFCNENCLWDEFSRHCWGIEGFLRNNNLPLPENTEYMSVNVGLAKSFDDFINMAADHKKAAGAVLWRFVKAAHPDMRNSALQNKNKKPEEYRRERRFQKNIMHLLGCLNLELSAKDKINALDYLEYRYSAEEYRQVYRQLGDFSFGEIAQDFDYERIQTVKLFHELLKECKKSTFKDKIVSAQTFLETVARNAQILEGVQYTDVYGNLKTIDEQARLDMLSAMKKSKVPFSAETMAYYEGKPLATKDMNLYLGAVLHKFGAANGVKNKKQVLSRSFAVINMGLQHINDAGNQLVSRYADYLFQYASYNYDNPSIRTELLEKLLLRNAEQQNNKVKASCLFEEFVPQNELKSIDKNLVLKIAESYAHSFVISDVELEEFNPQFHERMTRMFCNIVKEHDYKKSETEALCGVLRKNSDKAIAEMSRNIMSAYTQKQARYMSGKGGKTL